MSLPILSAASPTTVPEKVYDRVWVEEIVIKGPDPNGEVSGEVKLHKYGMFDGLAELEPDGGQWIRIENMLAESDTDADLAVAMGSLIAYVNKLGQHHDIISS
jgi:hypothetical protein|tara:strand:+ start:2695 stop:3003 length:309 start_codon:yes stop_codon:yes gene_type:complete